MYTLALVKCEYASSSTMVVNCAKCTEFIFLRPKHTRRYFALGAGHSDVNFNDFYAKEPGI